MGRPYADWGSTAHTAWGPDDSRCRASTTPSRIGKHRPFPVAAHQSN